MRMRTTLTIGAVVAGLALTACGTGSGLASGTHQSHARALSQPHVQQAGVSVSDVKDLATAKREHWAALLSVTERAQSR
jgi:outer membrane PBP1 activator LpoA protein